VKSKNIGESHLALRILTLFEKLMPYCLLVILVACLMVSGGDRLLAMSLLLVGGTIWLAFALFISKAITKLSNKQLEFSFGE
jgi:F0F1-type ATP synthase assembly protein I